MKKFGLRIVLSAFAALFMLGMVGCRKCLECVVKDEEDRLIYTYPRTCGNKDDIENYRSFCESEYGQYNYDCNCTEE